MGSGKKRERSVRPARGLDLLAFLTQGVGGGGRAGVGIQAPFALQVPMASERRKVKYHWSSIKEGCPSKRSCLREPSDVAPSSRPAHSSASRSRGGSSSKRLKAHKEDDVACSPRLSRSSARRRNSSSSSSSHSSGPGVGGAASKGCLIRSARAFLSSKGSSMRPANPSLEEMASLEEETCSLKVGRCHAVQSAEASSTWLERLGMGTLVGGD